MVTNKEYNTVIIIGAPRSGTNILRDTLCYHQSVATWPCDEINYIWKHGNLFYPSDAVPAKKASEVIKKYIRRRFDWVSQAYNAKVVVEKTCANSLRVPFVEEITNNAKYIFIIRDGMDVVGSSKIRWTADLDLKYIIRKSRFVPFLDLPYYAWRYFLNRIFSKFSSTSQLKFWGPVLDGANEKFKNLSLVEICAMQWKECVEKSEEALLRINPERVLKIHYEKLVENPLPEIEKVMEFIGLNISIKQSALILDSITNKSIGKGRSSLSDSEIKSINSIIGNTLKKQGYSYD